MRCMNGYGFVHRKRNKNTNTCSHDINGEINNDNSEMVKV